MRLITASQPLMHTKLHRIYRNTGTAHRMLLLTASRIITARWLIITVYGNNSVAYVLHLHNTCLTKGQRHPRCLTYRYRCQIRTSWIL